MELNYENVDRIAMESLLSDQRLGEIMLTHGIDLTSGTMDDEITTHLTKLEEEGLITVVEGILNTYAFDRDRLETHRDDILDMVRQLPDTFDVKVGGGWSFLNLAARADGELWAEHRTMESLCCLAIGVGLATWALPKRLWNVLPGGMPYVMFNFDGSDSRTSKEAS